MESNNLLISKNRIGILNNAIKLKYSVNKSSVFKKETLMSQKQERESRIDFIKDCKMGASLFLVVTIIISIVICYFSLKG